MYIYTMLQNIYIYICVYVVRYPKGTCIIYTGTWRSTCECFRDKQTKKDPSRKRLSETIVIVILVDLYNSVKYFDKISA